MRTLQNLSDIERRLVAELRRRIDTELTDIGFRMTVFGSRARGDAERDSDMNVLIEVDVDHISFADKRRLRRIATDVSIATGIIVSLLMVDQGILAERGDFSVFENVREEGIAV
jgi:predicted nucleotidyltransferase